MFLRRKFSGLGAGCILASSLLLSTSSLPAQQATDLSTSLYINPTINILAKAQSKSRIYNPLLTVSTSCRASLATAQDGVSNKSLSGAIDAILDGSEMQSAFEGVQVVRLRDNQTLYSRNADRVFLPASNNKLLTSFAALETLPFDFAYQTQVYALPKQGKRKRVNGETGEKGETEPNREQTGEQKEKQKEKQKERIAPVEIDGSGALHGDLVIVGGGDPTLTLADLDDLAHQVAKQGIRAIQGTVRYDDARFDRQWLGDGWTWDDEAAAYSAQVSALNINENCVEVRVWSGSRPNTPARVQILPSTNYITLDNQATTVSRSANKVVPLNIDRVRGQNRIVVSGNVLLPASTSASNKTPGDSPQEPTMSVRVTVEDPARFTASLFIEALRKAGIRVSNGRTLPVDTSLDASQSGQLLASHLSSPLSELLARMNKPSDNLMAECLLKAVGAFGKVPNGESTTTKGGKESDLDRLPPRVGTSGSGGTGARMAQRAFLAAGFQANGVHQADGSGLSRLNFVSPHNMVRLLTIAHERPYWASFYASLPIAGVDGTLRNRMKSTVAQNNCHAKTGTLSHVSTLSGYVTDRNGDLLVFSIMINNNLSPSRTSTSVQDRIVQLLADFH